MSFFGQQNNNQQQQPTGFGAFGANNNTTPSAGFGQQQNTGFGSGANNAGGSLFGGTTSGFGTGGTGFGSGNTTTNAFGANRPAFGTNTTSSGGIFGSNTATAGSSTGFGGFGATTSNTSGSLFGGASTPAFGTGGGLFGGASRGNTFGTASNQPTSAFGAPLSSALSSVTAESQGTGSTPFQPYSEKESGTNVSNQYQSISFMQPYKNFSFEELRVADYNQGRRYGNASGQAGAFGANTGFGGFGQQNTAAPFGTATGGLGGGIFGQSNNTVSPFGAAQTTGAGFGATGTGTGIFGTAPKPAGGLFGTPATSTPQQAGSTFGTAGQTGFGSSNTTGFGSGNTAGGLFGTPQAPKPGLFGTTGTGNAFGSGGTSNNSIFGGGQTASPFGGGQQQQQAPASNPFGGFGTNQSQAQTGNTAPFGGFGTGAQQTQKPGLFGQAPASGDGVGLFGANNQQANQQQPTSTNIFGTNTNNQSGGGSLFGPKPASTGTSIFPANPSSTANNTGGGLFGSAFNNPGQNQQNQTSSLFGNLNQQQQPPKPGGLFGTSGATAGSSLFNNNNNQQSSGSPFGNLGSGNQPQSTSLFGNTNNLGTSNAFNSLQAQPNTLQPPQAQFATLEANPYGNSSIFYGLPPSPAMNLGPVATPITTSQKLKKSAILPQYKINPNQASRLLTPQKRGLGFTYSTYGTPSSVSSNQSTPGSMLYSSVGRGLGKSFSTSNLRRTFDNDGESILSPGAFSASSSRLSGTGSLKRLTIDRSLRADLFGSNAIASISNNEKNDQLRQSGILKKKVSFDTSTVGGNENSQDDTEHAGTNGFALQDGNNNEGPSAQEQGFLRSSNRGQSRSMISKSNGTLFESEMEQVKGNELAIVHEDGPEESLDIPTNRQLIPVPQADPAPGGYWMRPSREDLNRMSLEVRKHLSGFSVGREGCGHVTFDEPVDLTLTPLNDIFDKLIAIETRSLTVYPDSSMKPALGQGLNVPSTIYLENSWPRQKDRKTPSHEKSGPRFNKHVDRLRKVTGTEFVRYEKDTGTWVFKVPHFTTYSLDFDDDEEGDEGESLNTSVLTDPPDTPTPKPRARYAGHTPRVFSSAQGSSILSEDQSMISSGPDDTFEFRKKRILPGAFDSVAPFEDNLEPEETQSTDGDSLYEPSAASSSESGADEESELQEFDENPENHMLVVQEDELEMAGSFPQGDFDNTNADTSEGNVGPRSILKFAGQDELGYGTPRKMAFNPSGDWAEELQRTVSPRKQDRQALRENQAHVLEDHVIDRDTLRAPSKSKGVDEPLKTSIDLMNSLFGQEQARRKGKGFEWPYSKKSKTYESDEDNMSEADQKFHESYKPHWGPQTTLLYAMPSRVNLSQSQSSQPISLLIDQKGTFVSERKDIRFAKFAITSPLIPRTLIQQRSHTRITEGYLGNPFAQAQRQPFGEMAANIEDKTNQEYFIWELAAILFDETGSDTAIRDLSLDKEEFDRRVRKENLIHMWQRICNSAAETSVREAPNAEERAIAQLSTNNIVEACDELVGGKDYRLAILVAQISGDRIMRQDMRTQIEAWRKFNVLSEMTDPIRALYELLAGNTCVCEGKKGPAEDRANTFIISERFGMDWKRAFGLRLWYGILTEEPIEAAVKKYADDLEKNERKRPLPWFLEEGKDVPWKDPKINQREDVLWGLLKLFAASHNFLPIPQIASIISPHNTTGNPIDSRLSFQLHHALSLRFPNVTDYESGDQFALDFAANLDSAGEWVWAIFILLHITSHAQRQSSIQSLLALHAADIIVHEDSNSTPTNFSTLTSEFQIPESWIWEAKALHARSVIHDHIEEVHHLLRARNWDEAHETLVRVVGPRAIIECDHDTLRHLLHAFNREGGREHIAEWGLGGGVYEDFVDLVLGSDGDRSPQVVATVAERNKLAILNRLLSALPGMLQEHVGAPYLEEVVAVREMSSVVAKTAIRFMGKGIEPRRILQLPLGSKGDLNSVVAGLGLAYYEGVMALEGGR